MKKLKKILSLTILTTLLALGWILVSGNQAQAAANYNKNGKPTWTILYYICGSDLEERDGFGTATIKNLCKASINENIRILVQTGGSKSWKNSKINPNKAMRFQIQNGKLKLKWSGKKTSMGNPSTLSSFISWSKSSYPSDHTILVISSHGRGPVKGVVYDTQFGDHSLTLPDLKKAFSSSKASFDQILFDCCITANLETASVVKPYAKYMMAYEETESGRGTERVTMLNYLAKHLDASIPTLGKIQIDATRKMVASPNKDDPDWTVGKDVGMFTFSLIRTSKIPAVVSSFNNYSKQLTTIQKSSSKRKLLNAALDKVIYFSQSEMSLTRTEFLDLYDMAEKTASLTPKASKAVKKAVKSAVVYQKNGTYRENAHGMYVFVPNGDTSKSTAKNYISRANVSKNYTNYIKLITGLK